MMKRSSKEIFVLLAILVLFSITNILMIDNTNAASIGFTQYTYDVKGGDEWNICLRTNSTSAIDWTSSNEDVVIITKHTSQQASVKAIGAGSSTITVTDKVGRKATCVVNVSVDDIQLSADKLIVGKDNSIELTAYTRDPITWTTSDSNIVDVDYWGTTVYVENNTQTACSKNLYGKGLGTATITATSKYGPTASCEVTVTDSYIAFEKQKIIIDVNTDDTASVRAVTGTIKTASSSNEKIVTASVNKDNNSIDLKAKGVGTATISATEANGAKDSFAVTVKGVFSPNHYDILFDENNCYSATIHSYDVNENSTAIYNVVSNNTNIVQVNNEYEGTWSLNPVSNGNATVTLYDAYGNKQIVTAIVNFSNPNVFNDDASYSDNDYYEDEYNYDDNYSDDEDYYDEEEITPTLKNSSKVSSIKYGDKTIKGKTYAKASVTARIAGKNYVSKATKNGKFTIKIPIKKIGTKVKITFKKGNEKCTFNKKIVKPGVKVYTPDYIYRKTKKMKLKVTNVHKGDIVTIKIGKKIIRKKVKKDKKSYSYNIKLPKRKKAGSKIIITVKNKYKQTLNNKKQKIYYASKIKKGMTKKQCKLVPGWESPEDIYVSGRTTTWWYDDDGDGYAIDSYLTFYKGKLYGWHY